MDIEETESSSNADSQDLQQTPEAKTNEQTPPENNLKDSENVKTQNISEKLKNFQGDAKERELYEEVLEKLDIKPREKVQDIQEQTESPVAEINKPAETSIEEKLKNTIGENFNKIEKLIESGLINSAQGQNLKKQVLKKAFDKLVQTEKIKRSINALIAKNQQPQINPSDSNSFSQSNPNFFSSDGRKEVLNYLESGNVNLGNDELNKISNLVRTVEKSAIERYLKKMTYEKALKESNEAAKQKLTANAQNSKGSKNLSRTFTREQIGQMSSKEFSKYESEIMAQLRKGQIK